MSEQTQGNVEVPLQVAMKDLKKVEQGHRLVEFNCRKKEKLAQEAKAKENEPNLNYSIGAVIVVGVLGCFGYYIYQRGSPGDNNDVMVTPIETCMNKFKME